VKAIAALLLCAIAGLAVSCRSTLPITADSIAGRYTVHPGKWYAYEDIALRADHFDWRYETDAMPGPDPISGRFSLDGCLLTFEPPQMRQRHRIITQRRGRFLMWTPSQYEEYLRTGRTPHDILYQTR
jgi:hypothetical protein